jgi:hypothetical protein
MCPYFFIMGADNNTCTEIGMYNVITLIRYQLYKLNLKLRGTLYNHNFLASSTTKTGRHDIAEILLKVALNSRNQSVNKSTKATYRTSQDAILVIGLYELLGNPTNSLNLSHLVPLVYGFGTLCCQKTHD